MKTLIVLLCLGAALARIEESSWLDQVLPNRKVEDSAFRPGREYQFFYNGQLSTGIAGASKQHSSNRIQALVTVAFKSQTHVIMRLEQVRAGKMNRQVPNPRKIMPVEAFELVQLDQHLKQKLEAPVKFTYTNGLIRDIEFDSREDTWSANLKRGVLNMLQVNLQQHRRVDTPEEARLINTRNQIDQDGQPSFYKVMEETLEGECETLYTIQQQPDPRHKNGPVLNVTKSINFEKCKKRPQVKYNFRFFDNCDSKYCDPKYNDDEKFLKSSTVVQYNITGDKQTYLIESARTESQYVFAPFNEEANVIVTYVNQTLVLVKSGPIQLQQEPQNPIKSDSDMIYTLDWNIAYEKSAMYGHSESTKRILNKEQQGVSRVESIKKILQKLNQQMKEQVDEEAPRLFTQLIRWMRLSDQQELEQIVRLQEPGVFSPEEEKKLQNIIPQALGACGTKECVKQLAQKIRQGQIGHLRGALALKGLLHSRAVSKEIINELTQLCESEKARESEILKRSCWLTTGSLINALCADNQDKLALEAKEDVKKLCDRQQKDEYVKLLFNKLRQSNKWQDKVLMLKTIGNAGLDLSIFELEKIIRQQDSTQHPMYIRMEAILALRGLGDDMPKKIQRVLMPIALNRRELPTIRSIASHLIIKTQPERPILDQLARSLINEPSHQFAAFVHTQLESYANSTNPFEQKLATDAKLALRQAKRVSSGLGYSKFSHSTFHNEQQKMGIDLDYGVVYSNVSAIPRYMGAGVHANRLGYLQRYLATVTLFNEGLEPLIRDYLNERGQFAWSSQTPNTLAEILQRHPRSVHRQQQQRQQQQNGGSSSDEDQSNINGNEYQRELDEIFSKHLKIRHRQYSDEHQNVPKAYLTTMFKSQTIALIPAGKEIVQQIVQEGRVKGAELLQKLQRGLPIDYATLAQTHELRLEVPTTMGIPLVVTMQAPVAVSVKGRVQGQVGLESVRSKAIKLQAELKPSAVVTYQCEVQAWSPFTVSGVKIQSKAKLFMPIDAKLEVEWGQTPQLKISIKPPTQKRDLVILETRPITFARQFKQYLENPADLTGAEEQTIVGEEVNRVSIFNKCIGRQTLGFEVCARGQVQHTPEQSPKGTPSSPFSGQNKIVVTAQPSESDQDIQIKINGNVQQLNGQEIQQPLFKFLGRQSPFQQSHWADVDSSSDEDSQESRQQQQQSQERQQGRQQQQQQQQQHNQQHQRHQQQRQQQIQQTFQKYREYQVKKGYKTQVNVEVNSGSNSKVNLELNHLYDAQDRYGRINAKLHRQQPEQWQACLDAEMMFPEQPQFVKDVKDKKILTHAQLRWGQTCDSQNFVQITTQAERSRQQVQWEREQSEYKQYNANEQCQNKKGWCSPLTQEDFVEKIGHMLKYRMDIDYQNVPQQVQNVTNKLYRALKHYYYWQTDVDQLNVQNQEGKILAELVLDAQTKQRLNVTIKTPKENVMIQDLPLAKPILTLNQKQPFGEQLRGYLNNQQEDEDEAQCSITGKPGWERRSQVETFDGTTFSAPFTDCWVVLAKDCGSSKPEFVVMARKSSQGGQAGDLKEVKIVTRQHRIQLTPESQEYDSIKVNVNGQQYDPENEQDIYAHGHLIAQIDKQGSTVSVELPEAGVAVEFDGYAINVKLSQAYQGQQCGLCGHYDRETADEFRNPDFTEEQDVRQFYLNYLIKDGCQAPKQLSEVCQDEDCDQDKSSSSSSSSSRASSSSDEDNDNDDTTEQPDQKTKVIEIDDQICFSTQPVSQCDDDSYPIEIKTQKQVQYVCIDQDSESAEEFERKARYGRKHIQGLTNRQPNFARTEAIPEKCKKYNKN